MSVLALPRRGTRRALVGLLTGLITSAALMGGQPLSTAYAAEPLWTAPPISEYPFERIEPKIETPSPTVQAQAEPQSAPEPEAETPPTERLVDVGIASTYGEGDGFQGRRTACGQRFDTNIPQVAHKTLPCGTMVRVEDTTSGKSVVAQVTDRGPYIRGRVVDLSWAAFSQLRRSPDLVNVRVYVLEASA